MNGIYVQYTSELYNIMNNIYSVNFVSEYIAINIYSYVQLEVYKAVKNGG